MSGAPHDRAVLKSHDVGVHFFRDPATQEIGYKILAGGGLGRTPMEGQTLREFLPREKLLSYLEAVLRVYNLEGRRDNKYKARIKILVQSSAWTRFAPRWKRNSPASTQTKTMSTRRNLRA